MSGQTASHTFIDFALYILHAPEPQPFGDLVNRWMVAVDPAGGIVARAQRVKRFAKKEGFTFETQECIDTINFWDEWHAKQGGGPVAY